MKVKLIQPVKIRGEKFPCQWSKVYESNVVPSIGTKIEDSLWKDPTEYEVKEVTINYAEDSCYVSVDWYKEVIIKERQKEMAHIADLHGWKCNW